MYLSAAAWKQLLVLNQKFLFWLLLKWVKVYSETEDAAKINSLAHREAADFLQVLLALSGLTVVSTCTVMTSKAANIYDMLRVWEVFKVRPASVLLSLTESHKGSKTQDCYQHPEAEREAEPAAQPWEGQSTVLPTLSNKSTLHVYWSKKVQRIVNLPVF